MKSKAVKTAKVLKMIKAQKEKQEAEYFIQLNAILDQIYDIAKKKMKWTWTKLAQEAVLSPSTVDRLGNRETKYPLLRTVLKLAKAVNLKVSLTTSELVVVKKKAS